MMLETKYSHKQVEEGKYSKWLEKEAEVLKSFEGNSLTSFTSGRFSKSMLVKQLVHLIPDNNKMIQTINGYELSLKDSRDVAKRFKRFHDKYQMGFKNYSEAERLKYLKR